MIKALVLKELRESAGVVVLAVLGLVYALASLTLFPLLPGMGGWLYHYPFVADSLSFYLALVAGGLAIALGLKQTAWELGYDTYRFLLHRPIPRAYVFVVKLVVGFLLLMLLSGGLILLYAWWAATPGNVPAPFDWSMTRQAWVQWFALPPVYFGAFLCGIRPGNWFGSKLVPLAGAIAAGLLVSVLPWVWSAALASLVIVAIQLVAIFHSVRVRDF